MLVIGLGSMSGYLACTPELGLGSKTESWMASGGKPQTWPVVDGSTRTSDYPGGGCYHAVERPTGVPLQGIIDHVGPTGVLTVDQTCTIAGPLVIPDRFTLRGAGWVGSGALHIVSGPGLSFDGGADDESHATVQDLQIQGPGSGTAFTILGRHQVHLRHLIVRGFDVGVSGLEAYSVDVDHCNFNQNGVALALGARANTWRIEGGICSQNWLCMDLHPDGDGNDTLVLGVRMESNDTAIRVGGQSTYIAFNRFEGNDADVERLPSASGTALLANNMVTGTVSDLSELSPGVLTGLPDLDRGLRLGIVDGAEPTAQLFTSYVPSGNLLRTQLLANTLTEDGVAFERGYHDGYASWALELDGSTSDATSMVRVAYRSPNDPGAPLEVFRIGADGMVHATGFVADSDARIKENVAPVEDALSRLGHLRGMRYDWSNGVATGPSMGLLAEDVEAVFPSAVHSREDGLKSVHYDQLTAPIVESIKELAAENARLRAELEALEARVTAGEHDGHECTAG